MKVYDDLRRASRRLTRCQVALCLNACIITELKESGVDFEGMEVSLKNYHKTRVEYDEAHVKFNHLLASLEKQTGYAQAFNDV